MPNYPVERPVCWVLISLRTRCQKSRWGWTNFMEPLCFDHFFQRRVVQNWLIILSGWGNWAGLTFSRNMIDVDTLPHGYEGMT